ncbi:hypothetical protein [Mesorhizobium sp. LCM 4576]|uniref:hypothetical protein n=1 Tax=Mesorhizobium sp. LCM 4576 TaxID=1848289 RepID=UPI001FCD7F1A|nr:hypothetical protein [Mesorhizobium sp. LCM 4576]
MLQLCLEMSVAQRRGELDIGSPYLAADQFIDRNADVCVEGGQHGKVGLTGTGRFAAAGATLANIAQGVDIDALGCQVGEEAVPSARLKERVHLEGLVADLELSTPDLVTAVAVELDLAACLQGRELRNRRRVQPRLDGDLGRLPLQDRPQGGKAAAHFDAAAAAGAGQ